MNNQENPCSEKSWDDCFEGRLRQELSVYPGCLPPWIDLEGLNYCNKSSAILEADRILMMLISRLDQICNSTCHYLTISSGSRNFERTDKDELRAFVYFSVKV